MSESQPDMSEGPEWAGAAEGIEQGKPSLRPRRRRWFVRLVVYALIAYACWCTAMYFFQDTLLFPSDLAPAPVDSIPAYVRELSVSTEKGRAVPAWFIPAPQATAQQPRPAVLSFHGNAEIIDFQDRAEGLWRGLGCSLLLIEYRGYGRARHAGKPSQESLVADGVKFFDALAALPEVDESRIIIHGYSIGGGVAAQVAALRKPAALVLEATFTSVAGFAWGYGVPPFMARHPFRTDEVLATLQVPIFIAHGRTDHIVPVEHGRRLHALVPTSTYIELDCGHLDLPGAAREDPYREELRSFLVRNNLLR